MSAVQFASSYSIPHPHRLAVDASRDRLQWESIHEHGIRGHVRPCGKGSFSFVPEPKVSKKEREYDAASQRVIAVEYQSVDDNGNLGDGVVRCPQSAGEHAGTLTLSKDLTGRSTVARRSLGLTLRGKKLIEDGCLLLVKKHGITNLGFYTLTLSLQTEEEVRAFNEKAATCLKRFLEKVKRAYEKKSVTFAYVGVWELHPSRSSRCGYPILHFHFVAPCRHKGNGEFVLASNDFRRLWSESVRTAVGDQCVRECRVGTEVLRKSASGYLSKYFSKGAAALPVSIRDEAATLLSSWYSISRNLLLACRLSCLPVSLFLRRDAEGEWELERFFHKCTIRSGRVMREIDGRDVCVGYWFDASPPVLDMLAVVISANVEQFL